MPLRCQLNRELRTLLALSRTSLSYLNLGVVKLAAVVEDQLEMACFAKIGRFITKYSYPALMLALRWANSAAEFIPHFSNTVLRANLVTMPCNNEASPTAHI